MRTLLVLAAFALGTAATCAAEEPKQVSGVDLFVDFKDYIGKEVILTDGIVSAADSSFMYIKAGKRAVTFFVRTQGLDRESLRFFLSNCSDYLPKPQCHMPLLVTPTDESVFSEPTLRNVKMLPTR
jgi:hypothetical protein